MCSISIMEEREKSTPACILFTSFRTIPGKMKFTCKIYFILYLFRTQYWRNGLLKILAVVYLVSIVGSALRQLILRIKRCQKTLMTSSPFWFLARRKNNTICIVGFYLADFKKTSCCAKVSAVMREMLLWSVKTLQILLFSYLNKIQKYFITHTHTNTHILGTVLNYLWSDLFSHEKGRNICITGYSSVF